MHTWHWQTWQDQPYLTCSLLEPWPHGFFSQQFWPQTPEDLVVALASEAAVYRVNQVHGKGVLSSSQISAQQTDSAAAGARPEADAVISDDAQQSVWVCTADCNPVLIADGRTGQVAAIHAGWRGTSLKVVPLTVDRLIAGGSRLEDLNVAMGPAIAGEVYQVSISVAAAVGRTIAPDQAALADEALVCYLQTQENPAVLSDPEPGRVRLDVRRVNALQLEQLGIAPEQVAIAPHCTYQEPERFFSYRRAKEKKVQWSGIVST
ncbi:peptidoglycan editing factor PgeF [Pseudanabaena sp. FACHB-2040]|uniref:peptidoglycan editing factor PgeF n=1 Tax=Pseudanabaena sp. FACHB-2040 TaxID=2692859 RepID=UPI0016870193|nr:peptidoglycan editing factor PgeF [Pseudanabaena sp. FACHB-2040]MBD2257103.1 peptidoglycan editing factor PgeF [Pseudanabaena sp. FACHB-2040]